MSGRRTNKIHKEKKQRKSRKKREIEGTIKRGKINSLVNKLRLGNNKENVSHGRVGSEREREREREREILP